MTRLENRYRHWWAQLSISHQRVFSVFVQNFTTSWYPTSGTSSNATSFENCSTSFHTRWWKLRGDDKVLAVLLVDMNNESFGYEVCWFTACLGAETGASRGVHWAAFRGLILLFISASYAIKTFSVEQPTTGFHEKTVRPPCSLR